MKKLCSWILMSTCVASAACGSDDSPAPVDDDTGDAAALASEECVPGTPEFRYGADGLSQADPTGRFSVRILDSNYLTPAKTFNTWTIQISDSSGAPMPQAHLTWACAWMPAHRHGSNPRGVMKLDGGEYKLLEQNFAMYGGWQVRMWIDPEGTTADYTPGAAAGAVGGDACSPTNPGVMGQTPNIEFSICVPRQRGS
jgi:hypothetical protein